MRNRTLLLFSLPLPLLYGAALLSEDGLPGLVTLAGPLIVIILLVALNGMFVASEFALIGVRPTQIEQMVNEGNRSAGYMANVLHSADAQKHFIATAQVGISLASLGLGMYGEPRIAEFVEPYLARLLGLNAHDTLVVTVGYVGAVALLTYLHIVIGEMVPKSMALSAPDRAALAISPFMRLMGTIFNLPVRLLNAIGAAILRLVRIPPAEGHARLHSPEELALIVSESAQGGMLSQSEKETIGNIFDFAGRRANQVMTPRRKIEAIPHNMPLPDVLALVANSKFSRFPVFKENIDHIIGVLHLKDLVCQQMWQQEDFDITLLLRPAPVVPEHFSAPKLVTMIRRRRLHMAIVLDEFGGTAGVVTLEDLIEEVVGEVRDEFDRETEPLVQVSAGVIEAAGDVLVEEIQEYFDLGHKPTLPDVDTVGGLVMAKLGRMPRVGDFVICNNTVRLAVLKLDGRVPARVRVSNVE